MARLNTETVQTKTAGDMRDSNTMMQLLSYVERHERLQEERDALGTDQKEVMEEAKGLGFDTKILRQAIRRRKMGADERITADSLLETYEEAIRTAEKKQVAQSQQDAG